jgi:parvulin-like peptidyl-prolyl isomerase
MPFGCNLLELVERREFTPVTFETARPQIEQFLFREKMDAEYASWIDKLREQVYIERKGIYAETTRLGADGGSRSALGP